MLTKKYFSPTIDDFRPGQFYEKKNGDIWELRQVTIEDFHIKACHAPMYDIYHELINNKAENLRIPSITLQDLTNLGWTSYKEYIEGGINYGEMKKGKFTLTMTKDYDMLLKFNDTVLFNGKILTVAEFNDITVRCDAVPNEIIEYKLKSMKL